MKLVTIYLPNGSKIKIECDSVIEKAQVDECGEIIKENSLYFDKDGKTIAKFNFDNIAGYQIEDVKDIKE